MKICVASTSSGYESWLTTGDQYPIFYRETPVTQEYDRIRCVYCNQKQNILNDYCQYCGAPLPDYP